MATATRSKAELLKLVVLSVLDEREDGTIIRALNNGAYNTVDDLLSMNHEDIDHLEYPEEEADGRKVYRPLQRGYKMKLRLFKEWYAHLVNGNGGKQLSSDQLRALQGDSFDTFRTDPLRYRTSLPPPGDTSPSPSIVNESIKQDLLRFKRGIKRDAAIYPTLRDDKNWDNWNRSIHAQARAHDVSEVLNPDYLPTNHDENLLFQQKQSFMYSVFNRCILTDVGKTFVRQFEKSYDALAVYRKMVEHANKSTAANLNIEKLVEQLTTTRLDSRWNGTTTGFIL